MPQKGSGVWKVRDGYEGKYIKEDTKEASKKFNKRAKTPEEKLHKKINKRFKQVKYIGDIDIDDNEYQMLIEDLKIKLASIGTLSLSADPVFAVALVQIGIKKYDSNYWSHLNEIMGFKIDVNKQRIVGEKFYNTLVAYNKSYVKKGEIVNNILLHCFITEHYASDFFEFMFDYYQYDLDRNLERHTSEQRDFLVACMKKAENSPRAFKIKKGTADAVTANETGCKIRIKNILKFIDSYFFEDVLPEESPNRIAKYFCKWAKNSSRFLKEKNKLYNHGKRGKQNFTTPYLHFNSKEENFYIVLPIQNIPLSDDELSAELSWKITYKNEVKIIESETENTVIGCRNIDTQFVPIEPSDIFEEIKIELIKNDSKTIRKFPIKSDTVRFFDTDFDAVKGADKSLPVGNVYAFTQRDHILESDIPFNKENYLGLNLYLIPDLQKGNIVKKPNGQIISVGNELIEGLRSNYLIGGAKVYHNDNYYDIFSKAPSILIKMKTSSQAGTLVYVNDNKFTLNSDNCIAFNQHNSDNCCCIISLENYCKENGIYNIVVDIPSYYRSNKKYQFALVKNFHYDFVDAPYIFKSNGSIKFNDILNVSPIDDNNTYNFDLTSEKDTLEFIINGLNVEIDIPVFKWKSDNENSWHISKNDDELWHKELPNHFYFKINASKVELYTKQEIFGEESKIKCNYKKDQNYYDCETRKILTWLDAGKALHKLYIRADDCDFEFITIVKSCILASCDLNNNIHNEQIIIRSNIFGFSNCAVDIYNNSNLIAEKLEVHSNGAELTTNKLFGKFDLIFYEKDDDDDDDDNDDSGFGTVYSEFAKKTFELKNKNSILGKKIIIDYITEKKKTKDIFSAEKYSINDKIYVDVKSQNEEDINIFYGISNCPTNARLSGLKIQIELVDVKDNSKALVFFYDEEEEDYVDFSYNINRKLLETSETSSSKYLRFSPENYYHISINK